MRKGYGPFKGTGAWLTGALDVEKPEVNSGAIERKPERSLFFLRINKMNSCGEGKHFGKILLTAVRGMFMFVFERKNKQFKCVLSV